MSLNIAEALALRQRAHGKDARVAEQKADGTNHRQGTEYSFHQLWDLGYRLLVPIVPPGAKISERSTILKRLQAGRDDRGKTPGVRGRDGLWRGFDWRPYTADGLIWSAGRTWAPARASRRAPSPTVRR